MADELHVHSGLPIQFFFKWKDHQHLVHELLDLLHPAFAPCPHLRADVIEDRRAGVPHSFRESKVEVGEVDKDCSGGRFRFDALRDLSKDAIKSAEISDDFERAHYSCLADVAFELNPGLTHTLPAEPIDLATGKFLEETSRHFGAVHVA